MQKISVVLEYKETGGGEIWPVEGRSGTIYGHATRCPQRGSFVLRMPLEQFRQCREDIFHGRKISYPPVPDFEIEETADVAPAPVEPLPPPVEEPIVEISNEEAAALEEASPAETAPPAVETPATPKTRQPRKR